MVTTTRHKSTPAAGWAHCSREHESQSRSLVAEHPEDGLSTLLMTPSVLARRALRLEYLTIGWNVVEATVALSAGVVAGSIALVGFGLDSVVEVFAASVVVWQMRGAVTRERDRQALRLIAVSFYALAVYVAVNAVRELVGGAETSKSVVGIVMAMLSLVIMQWLARVKRRTGEEMHSHTLVADSSETALCAYLSAILLGGLVLNTTVGWNWADPVAALGIAFLALREGREAWRGDSCCR
jgi:divalent metal cation (Fe/Co/Zn/Cd) transporter